jgi:hypothetical protein
MFYLNRARFDRTRPSSSVIHCKLFRCSIFRYSNTPIKINLIIYQRYRQRNSRDYPHVTIALHCISAENGMLELVIQHVLIIYTDLHRIPMYGKCAIQLRLVIRYIFTSTWTGVWRFPVPELVKLEQVCPSLFYTSRQVWSASVSINVNYIANDNIVLCLHRTEICEIF